MIKELKAMFEEKPEKLLQGWLELSKFFFMPRGVHHIDTIFAYVKASVPDLCDDDITASRETGEDYGQAEWKHYVRFALRSDDINVEKVSPSNIHDGLYRFY